MLRPCLKENRKALCGDLAPWHKVTTRLPASPIYKGIILDKDVHHTPLFTKADSGNTQSVLSSVYKWRLWGVELPEVFTEQKQTHIILKAFILIYYTYLNFRRLWGRYSVLCLSSFILSYL